MSAENRKAPLTVDDARAWVARIRDVADDAESAHGMEDALWVEVLRTIASGATERPSGLALAALATLEIDFPRWWCA